MKLIKQSVEYLPQAYTEEDIYKAIERAGRICYKSEDKITDSSAKPFVDMLIKRGHTAMLEHGTVYLCRKGVISNDLAKYDKNPYSYYYMLYADDELINEYVTTNYRVLVENEWLDDLKYICEPTEFHKKRYTAHFTTSIGIVRELLRHRKFSFANESTRYCNYSKDKFGNEITYIIPTKIGPTSINNGGIDYFPGDYFNRQLKWCEKAYFELLERGWNPEQARDILPLATKSELVMTGFEEDWNHFFNLRLHGTTGKPHPDIKALAGELEIKFWARHITNSSEPINEPIE